MTPPDGTTEAAGYVILDEQAVAELAGPYLGEPAVDVLEIGDGNLNLVFRAQGPAGSVVVKQALPYLRAAGESWPLTRHRARIEWQALQVHSSHCPELFPELLHFDDSRSALVMEDLRSFVSWRELIIAGVRTPGTAAQVGTYLATVLLATSDTVLDPAAGRALRESFVYSEMCEVTDQLVFRTPYEDSPLNRVDAGVADLAASLTSDADLRTAVAVLRRRFRDEDCALLHGDLHTGSVMVDQEQVRIIDLEFAFVGPPAFDLGSLFANLALARLAHAASGNDDYARELDGYAAEFWESFSETTRATWPVTKPWPEQLLERLLADSAQFAGLEMVRRIVGLAHAKDVDSLPQPARLRAQSAAIRAGRDLIAGPRATRLEDLWSRATTEEPVR